MTIPEYMRRFTEGSLSDRVREIAMDFQSHLDSRHILENKGLTRVLQLKVDILERAAAELDLEQ